MWFISVTLRLINVTFGANLFYNNLENRQTAFKQIYRWGKVWPHFLRYQCFWLSVKVYLIAKKYVNFEPIMESEQK